VIDIKVNLQLEFKSYQEKKYIKFYGSTLTYAVHYKKSKDVAFTIQIYTPLHITFHSNEVNMVNTKSEVDTESIKLNPNNPPTNLNRYSYYVSTSNNYLKQKIFQISNELLNDGFYFYFINRYGKKVNILKSEHGEVNKLDGNGNVIPIINYYTKNITGNVKDETFYLFQTLYKIEIELIYC
jgi:hypothetical protein